jgi:hypothetical protein
MIVAMAVHHRWLVMEMGGGVERVGGRRDRDGIWNFG